MSILKNKRTLSPLEYERRYMELYDYMTDRLNRLPRRYQAILGGPMREELGRIYDEVISISDMYVEGSKAAERKKLCRAAVKDLEKFGAWVYLLWVLSDGDNGIKPIEPRQRDYMAGLINRELRLLAGVGSVEGVTEMRSFKKSDIEKLDALKKLHELNGLIYPKIIRIPLAERDEEAALACRYIRDAFYCEDRGKAEKIPRRGDLRPLQGRPANGQDVHGRPLLGGRHGEDYVSNQRFNETVTGALKQRT